MGLSRRADLVAKRLVQKAGFLLIGLTQRTDLVAKKMAVD